MTTGYEIPQVDVPTAGFGAGFAIYLRTNTPTRETAEFFHIVRPSGSEVYACARITSLPGGVRSTPPDVDMTDQPVLGKVRVYQRRRHQHRQAGVLPARAKDQLIPLFLETGFLSR